MKTIIIREELLDAILAGKKTQHRFLIAPELMFVAQSYDYKNGDLCRDPDNDNWAYAMTDNLSGAHVIIDRILDEKYCFISQQKPAHIFADVKVQSIHIERLVDITDEDAIAEGIIGFNNSEEGEAPFITYPNYLPKVTKGGVHTIPSKSFFGLWAKRYNLTHLDQNTYVWVVKFKLEAQP